MKQFVLVVRRALIAMPVVLLIGLHGATSLFGDERPSDFGKQWVRRHPLTLMAVVLRNEAVRDNDLYSAAGLNTMLAWKDRPAAFEAAARQGIPWQFQFDGRRGPLSDELKSFLSSLVRNHPGGEGFLVWDEPKLPEMKALGEIVAWIKEAHPDMLVYTSGNPLSPVGDPRDHPHLAGVIHTNIEGDPSGATKPGETLETLPYSYSDYLHDIIHHVKPDVLMADVYPFWEPEKLDPDRYLIDKYFLMLSLMREEALKAGIPYWIFVQAYEQPKRCRFPSESDVRMQVYSSLAFGFTGVTYFTYDPTFTLALLDSSHQPTPLYQHVSKLNAEVARLGKLLRFLTSTEVLYVPGHQSIDGKIVVNTVPLGTNALSEVSNETSMISSVEIHAADARKNVLLGCFKDDDGGRYFMVVNLTHGENLSAAEASLIITISLSPTVRTLTKLSRETGEAEAVDITNHNVNLTIPGGTGELFILNSVAAVEK